MTVSFIHRGGPTMASYRYRAEIPARELGASLNDLTADMLVFAKPTPEDLQDAIDAKAGGQRVIVDFCDDHFDQPHYRRFAEVADFITCPTPAMADLIWAKVGKFAAFMSDPYEFPEVEPHCRGANLLWYGHPSNLPSLMRVIRSLDDYPLMIVSNSPMAMPWSHEEMLRQFAQADIVILPSTAAYKSANRAVEAIRQGCFVVAEPHPALEEIPGIYIGNLKEGVQWAMEDLQETRHRTALAQRYVRIRYSPKTLASAWRSLFARVKSGSTSEAEKSIGPAGSTSMASTPALT